LGDRRHRRSRIAAHGDARSHVVVGQPV
jgi:hypothetical protein